MKKLYRSTKDKKVLGVCGGLARYLGIDPTVVRIIWVVLSVIPIVGLFMGVLTYIIFGVVIPKDPDYIEAEVEIVDDE